MADKAELDFTHHTSAHCESGTTSNLLLHYGISASEALVFGMGSGLFFGYFPFIKLNGLPLITFRSLPRKIIGNVTKRLGIKVEIATFKDPEKSMEALDGVLRKGVPVGLQTSVYWLPYFPPPMREHFNSHFIVAYRINGSSYHISDPIFDKPVTCPREDLIRARFSKGTFAPNGRMFHFTNVPEQVDLASAVIKGIKETCFLMLKVPIPIMGVRGVRFFAKKLKNWPEKHGDRKTHLFLGNTVRLQEEVGTGGGGFRFMYAAFLQEAAAILNDNRLLDLSDRMTAIGDRWRDFAVSCARIYKNRASEKDSFILLSEILLDCADREDRLFRDLSEIVR